MAPNVFGDPITDETLKALPESEASDTRYSCLFVRQSTAAVVYFANNGRIGGFCKWLLAWHSGGFIGENKVFAVFEEPQSVEHDWEAIREKLNNSGQDHTERTPYGFKATVTITPGNTPALIATITLDLPLENA
ncbi:hypothetical protein FEM48_Zijuj04G0144100 [Ziziphus jujuba var. spinosa]|uniref:Uncharacterized protein n=1 Tax=Ziziphus jujuba var. spinosa TaxID=714518 RepID=A0A978VKE0_ZIZJJ|nr:hypothetical protein FEM48_Zijuj04G0144100 [Ziziphus jujuba var. spinosa]